MGSRRLNFTFDGEYEELNSLLNYQIEPNNNFDTKKIEEEVIFLHYLGNTKPWSFDGLKIIIQNIIKSIIEK